MKKTKQLVLAGFLVGVFLSSNLQKTFAQGHVIGSFPTMDGGMENQTAGAAPNISGSTLATGVQQTAYSTAQATSSVGTIATTGARSGSKCLTWTTGSTSNLLWTPTAANGAIQNSTSYVVQFYYTYASGSARAFVVGVTTDGSSGSTTSSTSSLAVASTYTKVSVVVTSGSSSNTPRYGMITFKPSGGSFGNPYVLDEIVMYPETAEDVTAPSAPTAASAAFASSTSLNVSFSAPGSGVDGGGYIVVRGTTDPTTAPNANGVYALGNSIGTGTVAYIGTATSFTDNGLNPNTTYYYRVYTVDKAFNYSAAATANGSTGAAPINFAGFNVFQKQNGVGVNWKTSLELNMDKFVIEKSADGNTFNTIESITAKGNNSNLLTSYDYLDVYPFNGNNFYRIKAIEKDGSIKYSSVMKVFIGKGKADFVVAPNPVKDKNVHVQLTNFNKGIYTIDVIGLSGQKIKSVQINHDGGSSSFSIKLPSTAQQGMYKIAVQSNAVNLVKQLYVE